VAPRRHDTQWFQKTELAIERLNERLGTGRKAQPLLEGFWRAGKQIKPFCSNFSSIERQAMSLSWPAPFRHSHLCAMCWESLVRFQPG